MTNTVQWRPDKANDEQGGGWRTKSYPQAYITSFGEGAGKPLFYQMRLHAIGTYDTLDAAKHAAERYYGDE